MGEIIQVQVEANGCGLERDRFLVEENRCGADTSRCGGVAFRSKAKEDRCAWTGV